MSIDSAASYDAILIPGGGLTLEGKPSPWVIERLDRAAELYSELDGKVLLMPLSAGTPHKAPILDDAGFPLYESDAGGRFLIDTHGVAPDHVRAEWQSLDTIGNAAFARWLLTDPNPRIRDLLVITSEFHMPRTRKIFEWVYGLPSDSGKYKLSFETVPNVGLNDAELLARAEREAQGLANTTALSESITTMADFHNWLATGHAAYAMALRQHSRPSLDPKLRNSY